MLKSELYGNEFASGEVLKLAVDGFKGRCSVILPRIPMITARVVTKNRALFAMKFGLL